ncbi:MULTISPECIES: universal stress protein [unclassified Methanoculleus]|uniref:universal stress protein n=1 Tax=unclassified Methanoculleus TaxID=2619537 RepID=UPI0025E07BA7|nr:MULTISPECIES: universal stress protein [unclassified Methanoculleus]MCK9316983.1 universal stress protein [Methanoculleus sp.]MDD2252857.1 universal stress protein [Methanoculleus sp.]MDD2787229.1 universal stress protein [Methanoculleus sp.]MDD3215726.1 universal stress protein [Methanoculleus sp.]MDD4313515.1 universal stress protein [Methanoculleus sp.]
MKILVLIDGSKWSQKAALHAIGLAKRKNAEVVLFSVLDIAEAKAMTFNFCAQSGICGQLKDYEGRIWRDMHKSIEDDQNSLLSRYKGEKVLCSGKIVEGNVRDEVVREANTGAYGLVVMGAFGKSGKTRISALLEEIGGAVRPPLLVVR